MSKASLFCSIERLVLKNPMKPKLVFSGLVQTECNVFKHLTASYLYFVSYLSVLGNIIRKVVRWPRELYCIATEENTCKYKTTANLNSSSVWQKMCCKYPQCNQMQKYLWRVSVFGWILSICNTFLYLFALCVFGVCFCICLHCEFLQHISQFCQMLSFCQHFCPYIVFSSIVPNIS